MVTGSEWRARCGKSRQGGLCEYDGDEQTTTQQSGLWGKEREREKQRWRIEGHFVRERKSGMRVRGRQEFGNKKARVERAE